jgi:hypothetical protein
LLLVRPCASRPAAAGIDGVLPGAAIGQRAAQYAAGFAIDEAAVAHAITTAISETVIGLAGVAGSNSQRSRGDVGRGADGSGVGNGVIASVRTGKADTGNVDRNVVANVGRGKATRSHNLYIISIH